MIAGVGVFWQTRKGSPARTGIQPFFSGIFWTGTEWPPPHVLSLAHPCQCQILLELSSARHFRQMSCLFHWSPQHLVAKDMKKRRKHCYQIYSGLFLSPLLFQISLALHQVYVTLARMVEMWCSGDQDWVNPRKDLLKLQDRLPHPHPRDTR